MINKLIYIFLAVITVTSCSVPYELSQQNLSSLYEYQSSFTQPTYLIYHQNDTVSTLYYSLQLSDFQYTKLQGQNTPAARIRLSYYLRESYESKVILDSNEIYLTDTLYFEHNKIQLDSISIPIPRTGEFLIEMKVRDINRDQEISSFIPVYKTDIPDQQYFMARDKEGLPIFSPYITDKQSFSLSSSKIQQGKIYVRYYNREFPIAIPPFAVDFGESFDYQEDSLFTIEFKQGKSEMLQLPDEGFYHFQPDTSLKEGFTLFRFSEDFPTVKTPEEALPPLRYITTLHEFGKISASSNTKLAIDSFWLENSGNTDRAKSLIAKYYNRVQDANRFFSSYIEGWKTDRGMVYIVFGPPNHVYRESNVENWVYGEAGYSLSLRFNFVRVNNPFSFNDFSLYRNPYFKEAWYNSVENWRR